MSNEEIKKISDSIVRIADKPSANYITAVAYKIKEHPEGIQLTAFGKNIEKGFTIASQSAVLYNLKIETVDTITQKDASGMSHTGVKINLIKRE